MEQNKFFKACIQNSMEKAFNQIERDRERERAEIKMFLILFDFPF